MNTPVYPGASSIWETHRIALIDIAANGTVLQSQRAIALLARELTARWWVSEWDASSALDVVASDHSAFRALDVPPGADPTAFVPESDPPRRRFGLSYEHGPAIARLFELYSAQNSAPYPTVYVRRSISEPLEDGTVHTYPAPPRSASIWSAVVAECSPLAAALIAEFEA